jgi:small conductance mechanosensitive channel
MEINNWYQLVLGKLALWLKELIRLLPNIALATIILVLGFMLAKTIRNFFKKLLKRFIHNEALDNLIGSLIYVFFIGIVVFTAVSVLKLDKAVTSILAGAGILGLALAFAFQISPQILCLVFFYL